MELVMICLFSLIIIRGVYNVTVFCLEIIKGLLG